MSNADRDADSVAVGSPNNARAYKVIIIGKSGVGKTTLLWRFLRGYFKQDLRGAVLDKEIKELRVSDDTGIELELWDTARLESHYTISPQYLRGASGIIMVYQITDPSSYTELKDSWMKMITTQFGEDVDEQLPILLVGSKKDLVNSKDKAQVPVRLTDVLELKTKHSGLLGPIECSSKTGENIDQVFQTISEGIVLQRPTRVNIRVSHVTETQCSYC